MMKPKDDRKAVLAAVRKNGAALIDANPEFQNDKHIVLAAVQQHGRALQIASEAMKNNKEVVLAAVQQDGTALQYASEEMKNDKHIVLTAVTQNGYALHSASEELKNDKEIVLVAVQQNGRALYDASPEVKNDKQIVLVAIRQNGWALEYTSQEFRNDKEIVLAAVQHHDSGTTLMYASEELKNDKEIVLAAIQNQRSHNASALGYASPELKNDKEVILKAIQHDRLCGSLEYASPELRKDKDTVMAAVQHNGWLLQYASSVLRNDKDVVLAAVKQRGDALGFASPILQDDLEVIAASSEFQKGQKFALDQIQRHGRVLKYADSKLQNDEDFILRAVQRNGLALEYANPEFQNNKDMVLAAVHQNGSALQFANEKLRNDPDCVTTASQHGHQIPKSETVQDLGDHPSPTTSIHVVILCAKFDEAEQLSQVFHHLQLTVREAYFHNMIYDQTSLTDPSSHAFIIDIYSCASRSGSVITAAMASEILHRSKPHWLFMTGVCAGNPNKVHLGDLLIAERVFDLRQGKAVVGQIVGQIVGDLSLPTINIRLEDPILRTAKSIQERKGAWEKLIPAPRPVSPRYKKEVLRWMLYQRRRELIQTQSTASDIVRQVGHLALGVTPAVTLGAGERNSTEPAPGDQSGLSLKEIQAILGQSTATTWAPKECANLLLRMSQATPPQIMYCDRSYKYYLNESQEQEINNLLGQQEQYPEPDPLQPKVHLGVIATDVSTVRADLNTKDWEEMAVQYNQRHLIGLEMEGYGLYETVKSYNETHHEDGRPQTQVILMKGVSDVGDPEKEDQFHNYGKQISGGFVYEFLRKYGYQMADKKHGDRSSGDPDEKDFKR